jgi:hypothetical protein
MSRKKEPSTSGRSVVSTPALFSSSRNQLTALNHARPRTRIQNIRLPAMGLQLPANQ